MKYINKILLIIVVLMATACSDFDDMNDNPNAPTSIKNNPELLLTGICKDLVNEMVDIAWGDGNLMAQYSAKIVFTEFDLFQWETNAGAWEVIYESTREIKNLQAIAEETSNDSYKAVSLILHSWIFQIATDIWGDIPYSEALCGKTDDIFYPAYDTQKEIYTALLAKLDTANTLLTTTDNAVSGDIILEGNLDLWQKFANSLRLRMLIRLTNVDDSPVDVASEIAKIVDNPDTYPIMTSNADNVVMKYTTSSPNVHPKSQTSGYRVGSFDEYRMSETIETVLEAYNDPREEVMFEVTSNSEDTDNPIYTGMINGMVDGDAYVYQGGSANLSRINPDNYYYESTPTDGILMLASEVQFIIAEAAIRYPAVAAVANAQEYYENGITLNFEYLGADMPDDYLTRTSSSSDYIVPVAFDNNIETVITQKWISLFYTDYQGFLDFKRTGYPTLIVPGPDAFSDEYPCRYTYPDEEQSLNYNNYEAAILNQASSVDDFDYWTPMWWEN